MMLLMKSMSIDNVENFPFPTHPGSTQLVAAEKTLIDLGAVTQKKELKMKRGARVNRTLSQITSLGRTMSHFPVGPRYSKMIALSFHHGLVEHTIALVAALTVDVCFLRY